VKIKAPISLIAFVSISLLALSVLPSCNTGNSTSVIVYAAGYYNNLSNDVAAYWKDDASGKVDLFDTDIARGQAIFVSGSDVYVAGYFTNTSGNEAAGYWKNGTVEELYSDTVGTNNARANGIFVDGTDVYVAGYYIEGGVRKACYWKNNSAGRTDLYTTANSEALDIYYDGTDVYAAGYYDNTANDVSCYWKNDDTNKTDLYDTDDSRASSIYVDGSDVYAAGYYVDGAINACYWQNTGASRTYLSSASAFAESIVVSGADVYVAGYYRNGINNFVACYWRNNSAGLVDLYNDSTTVGNLARAYSIFVFSGDVYAAGYYDEGTLSACYWKNGDRTVLYSAAESIAYSVVVK
jgi:hypothetical protein